MRTSTNRLKMSTRLQRNAAFTFAEVLITLGIIGVIAEMTIPGLMSEYKKMLTVTQVKKEYSLILQAIALSTVDNGNPDTWPWPAIYTDSAGYTNLIEKYILPSLKITKNCGHTTIPNECANGPRYFLSGQLSDLDAGYYSYFVNLADGTSIDFQARSYSQLDILIDINGDNPPNTYGKDIFFISLYPDSSLPQRYFLGLTGQGVDRASLVEACSTGSVGASCGALIQLDGWKMSDDYDVDSNIVYD